MNVCPNKHNNTDEALYCRICCHKFEDAPSMPFHMAHPEYHLRPFSEFDKVFFGFNNPDYMEDSKESVKPEYLYIVKDESLVFCWHFEEHWYGDTNDFHRVIQCEYNRIEKKEDMFICYKGSEQVYIDLKGNILK